MSTEDATVRTGPAHALPIDEPVVRTGLAANKLGVIAVAFFVVAAAAPMAAVVGASPVLFSSVGPATPVVYLIAALLIALFAVGYLRMSHHITNAGGFVAYIAKGIGNIWASGGAGLAILCYVALQVGLWAQFAVFAQSLIHDLTGLSIPPLVLILVVLTGVMLLTIRGVDASLKVLGVLIVAETLVIAILVASLIATHGVAVFSVRGFTAHNIFSPGIGVALLFAFLCYTSFEATVVFSEEAREPRRTIPRALYLVIAFVGIFYFLSTWVIGGAVGVDNIQTVATNEPATFIFDLAANNAGPALSLAMQVLVVTSFVAMLLGLNNMFSRYLFALGRAGTLPRTVSRVSRRGAPVTGTLINSGVIAVITAAFLLGGADPLVTVFAWFSALGTAAFIAILILTSVAIVVFFRRNPSDSNVLVTTIAPVLSIVAFGYVGYLTLANYSLLGGASAVAKGLLVLVPVALAAGMITGATKKSIDYAAQVF